MNSEERRRRDAQIAAEDRERQRVEREEGATRRRKEKEVRKKNWEKLYDGKIPSERVKEPFRLPPEIVDLVQPLPLSVRSGLRYATSSADVTRILRDQGCTTVANAVEAMLAPADSSEDRPESYKAFPLLWAGLTKEAKLAAWECEAIEKRLAREGETDAAEEKT